MNSEASLQWSLKNKMKSLVFKTEKHPPSQQTVTGPECVKTRWCTVGAQRRRLLAEKLLAASPAGHHYGRGGISEASSVPGACSHFADVHTTSFT